MQVASDVLVIGCGIAGLMAALSCAESGCTVTVVANGAGTIAISNDCIDLLGAENDAALTDPWGAMEKLPESHPYQKIGIDNVQKALDAFCGILAKHEADYTIGHDTQGKPVNTFLPTILGTLKPSYIIPKTHDSTKLFSVEHVLVCGIEGMRDLSPKLCADMLKRHTWLEKTKFSTTILPSPLAHSHRGVNALDIARTLNTEEGLAWLETSLGRLAPTVDLILIPPILGTSGTPKIHRRIEDTLATPVEELLSIPPGVGGIRLREVLMQEATALGVRFMENIKITGNVCTDTVCHAIVAHDKDDLSLTARAFILASGGILGGGLATSPDAVEEVVFGCPIAGGDEKCRTGTKALGSHPISRLGVSVDSKLHPLNLDGSPYRTNVFVAGRTLGGYDFVHEKSGHGVAIATGWLAGKNAAHMLGMEKNQ
ncbi:MAG: anaerobic glycerol-3-phosphate dehydrogenase subunit B [Desulfovibrionaceae bacterium]|nr:anaerobic glycerol-3-phosphate dehydrogenase subunit B [Desulfovibrionaceae bacterium]